MLELNDAVELPPHLAGWLTEYNNLKSQIKDLTEKADMARAHIESALGDSTLATVNGLPVLKWDYVDSRRFNQKKAQQLPSLDCSFTLISSSQRRSKGPTLA